MTEATRWALVSCDEAGNPNMILSEILWDGEVELVLPGDQRVISPEEAAGLPMMEAEGQRVAREVSAAQFRLLFTMAERIAMRADAVMDDAREMAITQGKANLDSAELVRLMDYAVGRGIVTRARADAVIRGEKP